MTCTNELGLARARGSAAVGLVGGKGFSCYLRQRGRGGGEWGRRRAKNLLPATRGLVWLALGRNGNLLR